MKREFRRRNTMLPQEQHDALRARLHYVIRLHPDPMNQLAREVGISAVTLRKFLFDGTCPQWSIFLKIENWVLSKEKEFGILKKYGKK